MTHTGTEDDRIIGASSDVAERAEIHDMKMEGDVMRMFQIDGIDLTAGKNFQLGKGNKLHIMLMGLKQPLKAGEQFTLHVQFEKAGVLPVQVTVRDIKARGHGNGYGEGHGMRPTTSTARHTMPGMTSTMATATTAKNQGGSALRGGSALSVGGGWVGDARRLMGSFSVARQATGV